MSDDSFDVLTLAGRFKSHTEVQKYCDQQYNALSAAATKINQLEEEITHLKNLLITTSQLIPQDAVSKIIVSPEEMICDVQIRLLQERSMSKELTLNEVKILDLLIKNKRLIKEQSTIIAGESKPIESNLPKATLLKLASNLEKEEEI